ncbi:hypothetical protein OUZ56_020206 [Daphnia magna]|uniref:Uncharacterized protein n=1 Tax=Daphnia magna TaxID=35525 RepID=A0ABQ9ZDV3_9CRUS|nr:hypothetical protein OUZ56_020206 [Daphnia magna]
MESRSSSSAKMRTLAYMPVVEVQGYNAHNKLQLYRVGRDSFTIKGRCVRRHLCLHEKPGLIIMTSGPLVFSRAIERVFPPTVQLFIHATYNSRRHADDLY